MVIHEHAADFERFVLLPNRSASWAQIRSLIVVVLVFSLSMMLFFLAIGAWLIAPFCGAKAALLIWALWYVNQRTCWREVITLTPERVEIARGRRGPVETITLERFGLQLHSHIPDNDFYMPHLALRRHARDWVIGEMLNREDRITLIRALKRILTTQR